MRRSNGPDAPVGMRSCLGATDGAGSATLLGVAPAKRPRAPGKLNTIDKGSATAVQPAFNSPAMAPPLPPKAPKPEPPFHPHDTFKNTASTTMQTTFVGLVAAASINALTKKNVGAWGVISRNGGVVALFCMQLAHPDPHTS